MSEPGAAAVPQVFAWKLTAWFDGPLALPVEQFQGIQSLLGPDVVIQVEPDLTGQRDVMRSAIRDLHMRSALSYHPDVDRPERAWKSKEELT